jgi:hypothetical protein
MVGMACYPPKHSSFSSGMEGIVEGFPVSAGLDDLTCLGLKVVWWLVPLHYYDHDPWYFAAEGTHSAVLAFASLSSVQPATQRNGIRAAGCASANLVH